ncbi:MAG: tail fiber domain-containing protein, partial [Saprospiraceae bacterium]
IRVGNTSVTTIEGQVNFTATSDARFKRNVTENVPGLEFISRLRPITYTWDIDSLCRHIGEPLVEELKENRAEASAIVYTGFLSQEVEAAAQQIDFNFSGVKTPKSDRDTYGLRYAEFTVPLVKAVQELQSQIEELRTQNQVLETRLNFLEKNNPR